MGHVVRVAVVVAETEFGLLQEAGFQLAQPARQIKDKRAQVRDVEARIVEERVVLQGAIHGEIYYVGMDSQVHHQRQVIPFQTLCSLPGAQTGMDVWVESEVDEFILLPRDEAEMTGKFFLRGQLVITKKETMTIAAGPDYRMLLPGVVGSRREEVLVKHDLSPSPPPVALGEMEVRLQEFRTTALHNRVAVEAELREEIYYTGTDGREYNWREMFRFNTFLPVPGVEPGDEVEVEGRVGGVSPGLDGDGILTARVVLELEVEVSRPVQLGTKKGAVPVRAPLVLGENTRERLLNDTWLLEHGCRFVRTLTGRVGELRGQSVAGRVLLEGILEKEATFISAEGRVEYHQVKQVPFTDFLTIQAAREGLPVQASARVLPGGWRLRGGQELEERMIIELYAAVLKPAVVYVEDEGTNLQEGGYRG